MAHDHQHDHGEGANARRLVMTLALVTLYMGVEVVGGVLAHSLALIADAGHMLSDAGALGLTLFAMRFARRPPTAQRTFGSYRAEILAALANGATLVAVAIYIFVEAFERFRTPPEVQGPLMLAVACGGLLVNAGGLWLLRGDHADNLNMRGAWLHVLTDALDSSRLHWHCRADCCVDLECNPEAERLPGLRKRSFQMRSSPHHGNS